MDKKVSVTRPFTYKNRKYFIVYAELSQKLSKCFKVQSRESNLTCITINTNDRVVNQRIAFHSLIKNNRKLHAYKYLETSENITTIYR